MADEKKSYVDTAEYVEGRRAFREGLHEDENPYPTGKGMNPKRIAWFDGFFDARTKAKFGNI